MALALETPEETEQRQGAVTKAKHNNRAIDERDPYIPKGLQKAFWESTSSTQT